MTNKRVNGQLAVSRALGDNDFKGRLKLVTACPEITHLKLQQADDFVLMACDGLWDVLTSQQAVAFVTRGIKDRKPLQVVCRCGVL